MLHCSNRGLIKKKRSKMAVVIDLFLVQDCMSALSGREAVWIEVQCLLASGFLSSKWRHL